MKTIYKKTLDISKKIENTANDDETIKVPVSREKVIKALRVLKGLQRALQEAIRK